jgi:hypothetical protein
MVVDLVHSSVALVCTQVQITNSKALFGILLIQNLCDAIEAEPVDRVIEAPSARQKLRSTQSGLFYSFLVT